MKAVCHTNASNPSQALVKSIRYPERFHFTSKQRACRCMHEKSAIDAYKAEMKDKLIDCLVSDSGFVINPQWPCMGASPGSIISCKGSGRGVLEVNCSYCHRH